MKVYPFARDNAIVEQIALRLAGSDAAWNHRADRLDLASPELGEPIHLEARIDVDVPTLFSEPILPMGQPISLIAIARCRDTRWSSVVREWSIPVGEKKRFTPDPELITIDSNNVSGQFRLVFCLCLAADRSMRRDRFARRRWNIVAEKRFSVLTSGSGGSITEWVSFSEHLLPPGLWHLRVAGGDLDQSVTNLRLYLNKDVESFRRLLSSTSGTQRERALAHTFTRRMIRAAFIEGMISLALSTPRSDIPDDPDALPGTCWEVALNLCAQLFPDLWNADEPLESFRHIQREYATQPNRLETLVQAVADLPLTLERSQILNPSGAS